MSSTVVFFMRKTPTACAASRGEASPLELAGLIAETAGVCTVRRAAVVRFRVLGFRV